MQKSFLLFKVLFGQNLSFLLLLNSNKIIRKIWVLYHILRSYCSMSAAIQRRSSMTNARSTRVACQCSHFFRLQKFRLMHSTNHVMHEPCSNEKSPTNWTLELKESKSLTFKSCPSLNHSQPLFSAFIYYHTEGKLQSINLVLCTKFNEIYVNETIAKQESAANFSTTIGIEHCAISKIDKKNCAVFIGFLTIILAWLIKDSKLVSSVKL